MDLPDIGFVGLKEFSCAQFWLYNHLIFHGHMFSFHLGSEITQELRYMGGSDG